jgi:ATP-dependent Clp protease ATP-binding subunit ClpA
MRGLHRLSLQLAREENNQDYSNEKIGTGHVLLRLLQEKKCLAAKILDERSVCPESSRKEPAPVPQGHAIRKKFVRERDSLPKDVVEPQDQISLIASNRNNAISNHDLGKSPCAQTRSATSVTSCICFVNRRDS